MQESTDAGSLRRERLRRRLARGNGGTFNRVRYPEGFREALESDVLAAAPMLLGMRLRRGALEAQIVEVEAYRGSDDPACHAFGKTKMKNMAIFGAPGHAYVYFNYGVHWMLNLVAHPVGNGSAILIRAAEPITGHDEMKSRRPKAQKDADLLSGPGKLAAAFNITSDDNGKYLLDPTNSDLAILPGAVVSNVVVGPRVGIAVGKAHDYPWRFIDADRMQWASRPWIL